MDEQLERISTMERILNANIDAVAQLNAALDAYLALREDMAALEAYYGSPDWFRDRDDDSAGKLPQALSRGVLTEDAVWDLLIDTRELHKRLAVVADEQRHGTSAVPYESQ